MRELKRDLQSMVKSLKALTQKTEKMAKELDRLEKAQTPKRPKAKPKAAKKTVAKKPAKLSASGTVLAIVKRSRRGVDKATLIRKTGFKDSSIHAILYRLTKQGKIKRDLKGLYVKT